MEKLFELCEHTSKFLSNAGLIDLRCFTTGKMDNTELNSRLPMFFLENVAKV